MSGNRTHERVEVVTESPEPGHAIRRFLITVCILAAVLYGSIYFACRTDGFRSYAEEFLESRLGIPVHVKRVQSTMGLNIILSGVTTEDDSRKGAPGYRVRKAVIRWSLLNRTLSRGQWLSGLELKDCSVSFAPGKSGEWEPVALAKLGTWLAEWGRFSLKEPPSAPVPGEEYPKPAPKLKADFWDRVALSIENGNMSWWDAHQREMASADGIRFDITPVILPNRKMTHYYLTLANAQIGEQKTVRNLIFEMLKTGSNRVVLTCLGDWGTRGGTEDDGRGVE